MRILLCIVMAVAGIDLVVMGLHLWFPSPMKMRNNLIGSTLISLGCGLLATSVVLIP